MQRKLQLAAITAVVTILALFVGNLLAQNATTAIAPASAAGDTQIVAGAVGLKTYINNMGISLQSMIGTALSVQFIATTGAGAGTTCLSGPGFTAVTGILTGSSYLAGAAPALPVQYGFANMVIGTSSSLCVRLSGAGSVGGYLTSYQGP